MRSAPRSFEEMIRLGLCCTFQQQPIRFRRTTARYLLQHSRLRQLEKLSELCRHNADALLEAMVFCSANGIGSFRINSQVLPLKTHPQIGYEMTDLPEGESIVQRFQDCGRYGREQDIRLSFHPDQFVVLSAEKQSVLENSIRELLYQAEVAEWVGADVINVHGGGAYGDKQAALERLSSRIRNLPEHLRSRLTLENDDRVYRPADLLPICESLEVPLVYDIHHHRCLPDSLSPEEATRRAMNTWNREPLFHISSPLDGWEGKEPRRHHDYISMADFPGLWLDLDSPITVDVEAKAKELAVLKLKDQLQQKGSVRP